MSNLNKYDFVIYGATGFTGKLVVEYAINQYNNNNEISWACLLYTSDAADE